MVLSFWRVRPSVSILLCCLAWYEAAGGQPRNETLQEYLERRAAFLNEQDQMAGSSGLNLSDAEVRFGQWLDQMVQDIVQEQRIRRLTQRFTPDTYFPLARPLVENSTLFQVLHRMPKGGVLHLHAEASGPMEWVVGEGLDLPGCHVYLGSENRSESLVPYALGFFNDTEPKPAGFRPVLEVLQERPNFRSELLRQLTVSPEDANLTSPEVWQKFQDVFIRFGRFMDHRLAYERYLTMSLRRLVDDGISHVEFRIGLSRQFGARTDLDGRRYEGVDIIDMHMRVFQEVHKLAPQLTMKLIASTIRSLPPDLLAADLEYAYQVAAARPGVIVGWDMAGEEDANHKTIDYLRQLLEMPNLEAKYGVKLPLILHDGESDWPSNVNAVDAALLGAKRIGHGFNVFNGPLLRKYLRLHGTAVEVCPISNQVLHYVDDLRLHPGSQYLREGVPMSISSDDPGIWGASGLTHDFWEVTVAWQLGVRSLKFLVLSSLHYSGLNSTEQEGAIQRWEADWADFLKWWEIAHSEGAASPELVV